MSDALVIRATVAGVYCGVWLLFGWGMFVAVKLWRKR
jgi:hypothetical protein